MSTEDRWERLAVLLLDTDCDCGHKGHAHDYVVKGCARCECQSFHPVLGGPTWPWPGDPPGSSYREPVSDEHKALLNRLADSIRRALPPGWGFGLFLFTFGDAGTMAWISNAQRSDMVKALQEWMRMEGS